MLERKSQRRDGTQPMRDRERYCTRIRVRWTDPEAHRQAPELGRKNLSDDELPRARGKASTAAKRTSRAVLTNLPEVKLPSAVLLMAIFLTREIAAAIAERRGETLT